MFRLFSAKPAITECKTYSISNDYEVHWTTSLGVGASGRIRSGISINTGDKVAIKVLPANDATRLEIKTHLACLKSCDTAPDHIVNILDVFYNELNLDLASPYTLQKGLYYIIVLEYMDGKDLYSRIASCGVFSETDAKVVILNVIEALQIVHATPNVIAHGDIKPENILFSSREGISAEDQHLKLADFGLVITRTDQKRAYTPYYVDPYTLSSAGKRTNRSDIWSLGVVLYILLIGYAPFSSENQHLHPQSMSCEMKRRILRGEFLQYKNDFQSLSTDAKDLIESMLTVDHKNRITLQGVKEHPWITGIKAFAKT